MAAPIVFVTGTDTGVGKTLVTRALAAALSARGVRVAALKPIETGCASDENGELVPEDARLLQAAAGNWLTLDEVIHERFPLPASPAAAAAAAGRAVDLPAVIALARRAAERADLVLVEGAGGLLVPLDERRLTPVLVAMLGADLVIVARDSLGTVNHTLLTISEARRRSLPIRGVILSRICAPGPDAASNAAAIAAFGDARMLGTLPHLPGADHDALARAAAEHLDLSSFLPR